MIMFDGTELSDSPGRNCQVDRIFDIIWTCNSIRIYNGKLAYKTQELNLFLKNNVNFPCVGDLQPKSRSRQAFQIWTQGHWCQDAQAWLPCARFESPSLGAWSSSAPLLSYDHPALLYKEVGRPNVEKVGWWNSWRPSHLDMKAPPPQSKPLHRAPPWDQTCSNVARPSLLTRSCHAASPTSGALAAPNALRGTSNRARRIDAGGLSWMDGDLNQLGNLVQVRVVTVL